MVEKKTRAAFPRLGFLGVGSMGGALARAARRGLPGENICLSNRTAAKAEALARELGCEAGSSAGVSAWADFLLLGVKPQMMEDLLEDIRPALEKRERPCVLVTMAAGLTIARIRELAGVDLPILRIMPNTPASIGEGMILYACGGDVAKTDEQAFLEALSGAGRFARVEERLIDAGSAVSGCGPAFADLFLEALADGGVACGLPRALALELAAQMLAGSAKLVLESGAHPGVLKDAVCSPAGSTIQGVRALERGRFRGTVMEAVISAFEKNQELGK